MANFRTNHQKTSAAASGGMMTKIGLFAAIIAALFWGFNQFSESEESNTDTSKPSSHQSQGSDKNTSGISLYEYTFPDEMLPTSTTGQVVHHDYYCLSYSEEHEQPEWVAYELTRESLIIPNVPRTGNFRPDPKVSKASASDRDYRGTGYDRGHMVPAGDMAFSEDAMSQTFYMSNMSPQIRNFNGGIWRELEENVRDWAYKNKHLYIVTGPVLNNIRERIGYNQVSVPDKYFKVILDYTEPELKAIAFLMSNEISYQPLQKYATTIDEVEAITGIDFFPNLLQDSIEEKLESTFDISKWKFNNKKFQLRNDKWNKRR